MKKKTIFAFFLAILFLGNISAHAEELFNSNLAKFWNCSRKAKKDLKDGIVSVTGLESDNLKYFHFFRKGKWNLSVKLKMTVKFKGSTPGQKFGILLKDAEGVTSYYQIKAFKVEKGGGWQEITVNLERPWPKRPTKADLSKIVYVAMQIWKPGTFTVKEIKVVPKTKK